MVNVRLPRRRPLSAVPPGSGGQSKAGCPWLRPPDGHIGGLNGVLHGAAADAGLRGTCLLGEMPHIFSQLPFPKASLAILEVFTTITGIEIDFAELAEQARVTEQQLGELLARVEQAYGQQQPPTEEEGFSPEPAEEGPVAAADRRRIEELFTQAARDRTKAFELKQELVVS